MSSTRWTRPRRRRRSSMRRARTPAAALVESGEYFYGTTNTGGANGQGTIFRLRFDGSEFSVLHVFTTPTAPSGSTVSVNDDGALPQAGLTDGGDGLLYGTTTIGGANGVGVLYSITPDGAVRTTLHDFEPKKSAANPSGRCCSGPTVGSTGRRAGAVRRRAAARRPSAWCTLLAPLSASRRHRFHQAPRLRKRNWQRRQWPHGSAQRHRVHRYDEQRRPLWQRNDLPVEPDRRHHHR